MALSMDIEMDISVSIEPLGAVVEWLERFRYGAENSP